MRPFILVGLLAATPTFADTIEAVQRVTAVTVYREWCQCHARGRVRGKSRAERYYPPLSSAGARPLDATGDCRRRCEVIGTTLMAERLPVVGDRSSPEIDAARAEIKRLEG